MNEEFDEEYLKGLDEAKKKGYNHLIEPIIEDEEDNDETEELNFDY